MKYFIIFILSLIIGLVILLTLGYIKTDFWFLFIIGFQWVTEYIVPWVILFLLIFMAKSMFKLN